MIGGSNAVMAAWVGQRERAGRVEYSRAVGLVRRYGGATHMRQYSSGPTRGRERSRIGLCMRKSLV